MIYLLSILCLSIMSVFIYFEKNEKYVLAVFLKGLASLMFVLLGSFTAQRTGNNIFSQTVKIGLVLGMIADILLNLRYVFKTKGKIVFLIGILVFLSGHIAYLLALIKTVDNVIIPLILGVILSVLLLKWIFSKIEAQKAFKIFGVFYIGAIVTMNCFAMTNLFNDLSNMRYVLFAIGAFMFLISDVVLILNTFGKTTSFKLRVTNLTLYYIGQLLIAVSLYFPILYIA